MFIMLLFSKTIREIVLWQYCNINTEIDEAIISSSNRNKNYRQRQAVTCEDLSSSAETGHAGLGHLLCSILNT
uniref:Uncharacterized protein n=1 Tax=Heterorhabditis bacteriophora TaxID=37862 RepID=A0A1I7X353_HETBA